MNTSTVSREIYTVSRLNREVRTALEGSFPLLWIQAEISNLARPASGHWYFSLKDQQAQVRCAMFRNKNRLLRFTPEDGQLVLVRAKIGLYEPRGEFQIIIEHMEIAGEGALQQQFEQLKQKLNIAGLFDSQHKTAIPAYPKTVGIITSSSGAAVHDILTTLKRRFASLRVIIYPTSVQGKQATNEIISAIRAAEKGKLCDVLIIARGGGSIEDLWSFNSEQLAHQIYNCKIPIVSGIGHDIDFTIADFVADHRAPTPTGAAEYISPDQKDLALQLNNYARTFLQITQAHIKQLTKRIDHLANTLQHPGKRLEDNAQRLDELSLRLTRRMNAIVNNTQESLLNLNKRLLSHSPAQQVYYASQQNEQINKRLINAIKSKLQTTRSIFERNTAALHTISPLATIERGYAIVTREVDGKLIQTKADVSQGDNMLTKVKDGIIKSTVTGKN